jgi:hypothetical protein
LRHEPELSLSQDGGFDEDVAMRRAVILCSIVLLISISSSSSSARSPKSHARALDPAYSSALAAANRFLQAWEAQDHETAVMMLSDAARQHSSPELLQAFFTTQSQAAFEIGRGRRIQNGEYVFPVALFGMRQAHPRYCTIVVTRGKNDWMIDKLP